MGPAVDELQERDQWQRLHGGGSDVMLKDAVRRFQPPPGTVSRDEVQLADVQRVAVRLHPLVHLCE